MGRKRKGEAEVLRLEEKQREDEKKEIRVSEVKRRKEERRKEEEKKEEDKRVEWRGKITRMVMESIVPVARGPIELKASCAVTQVASPNMRLITRSVGRDPLKTFLKVIPSDVWNHLCEVTNLRMDEKVRLGEVRGDYAHKYYGDELSVQELLKIVGIRIGRAVEAKTGNRMGVTLGIAAGKRLNAVASSLSCDWGVFVSQLREAWKECIVPSEAFVVDESMFAYQPRFDVHCNSQFKIKTCNSYYLIADHSSFIIHHSSFVIQGSKFIIRDSKFLQLTVNIQNSSIIEGSKKQIAQNAISRASPIPMVSSAISPPSRPETIFPIRSILSLISSETARLTRRR